MQRLALPCQKMKRLSAPQCHVCVCPSVDMSTMRCLCTSACIHSCEVAQLQTQACHELMLMPQSPPKSTVSRAFQSQIIIWNDWKIKACITKCTARCAIQRLGHELVHDTNAFSFNDATMGREGCLTAQIAYMKGRLKKESDRIVKQGLRYNYWTR